MVCAFTGHRPQSLPWGSDESDVRCIALKALIAQAVHDAYRRGSRTFLCGMARGCDTYFAEALLALKLEHSDVCLTALVPCPTQAQSWSNDDRARYEQICRQFDNVEILEQEYSNGCMLRRNLLMVSRADMLISVWDGSQGGTAQTIRAAKKQGLEIVALWR